MINPKKYMTIIGAIFLCLIIICPSVGYPQDSLDEISQDTLLVEPTEELKEAEGKTKWPFSAKKVTAIEVKGNRSTSSGVILSKIKTRVGAEYSANIISDDIKRLNELGYFSDISIDTEDFQDGLKVIVLVAEKPIIAEIILLGRFARIIKKPKVEEALRTKKDQYLDRVVLKEDISTLKDMFLKKGYPHAKIEYNIDPIPETNKIILHIDIDPGKRIKIKKIDIMGNENFSDKRLLKLLETKKAWLFNSGFFEEGRLRDDVERLKSFYRREGYSDVRVDYETGLDAKEGLMFVTIRIDEGRRYLIGKVFIQGNIFFTDDQIMQALKVTSPESVFSQEGVRQDVVNIQSLYFDKGYIFTQVNESIYLNPSTDMVDITYTIDEGIVAYVDRIKIRGNIKTKDIVIRRELRIFPGERFDGSKLKRSKSRLENLGFFQEVSYDIAKSATGEPDKKDLIVEVKESKTGEFSFGGGYSSVDKLIGFIEVAQKNFDWQNFPYFTGAGQDLRLRAELGEVTKSNYELSFTEPWMFDYPISFGFDGYRRVRERETDVGYGYNEKRVGGDLRLGKELSEYTRGNLFYRLEEVDITDISDDASDDLKKEIGKNVISALQFGLTQDTRDNIFDPSEGYVLGGNIEVAGGPIAGDKDFAKLSIRASKYFSLPKKSVVEFKLRAGWADAYGESEALPIYERFYAGGAYTIRGYEERGVGPIDPVSKDPIGGNFMLIGNVEYLYPVVDFVKLAVFYDIGNVWKKITDFDSDDDYKAGVGLGVRLKTPIGPVRLDYGWPLDIAPGKDERGDGEWHFSLSHGF